MRRAAQAESLPLAPARSPATAPVGGRHLLLCKTALSLRTVDLQCSVVATAWTGDSLDSRGPWGYKWTAGRCSDRCIPDALCFSNPTQCDAPQPPKPEWNMDCVDCIRGNNTWQVPALGGEGQCHDGLICPRHLPVSQCTRNINDCRLF